MKYMVVVLVVLAVVAMEILAQGGGSNAGAGGGGGFGMNAGAGMVAGGGAKGSLINHLVKRCAGEDEAGPVGVAGGCGGGRKGVVPRSADKQKAKEEAEEAEEAATTPKPKE